MSKMPITVLAGRNTDGFSVRAESLLHPLGFDWILYGSLENYLYELQEMFERSSLVVAAWGESTDILRCDLVVTLAHSYGLSLWRFDVPLTRGGRPAPVTAVPGGTDIVLWRPCRSVDGQA